jgi:hypothetical protein
MLKDEKVSEDFTMAIEYIETRAEKLKGTLKFEGRLIMENEKDNRNKF